MGRDEVNVSSWARTEEGPIVGYSIVLGMTLHTGGVPPFHLSCPLIEPPVAVAAWQAARGPHPTPPDYVAALRAALPAPAQLWLDSLPTIFDPRDPLNTIDLQLAAVHAAANGPPPGPIPPPPPGLPPYR
jgi:hypothetical protein